MEEGHVAHFPMESARAGAMLPSVQISSRGQRTLGFERDEENRRTQAALERVF